MLVDGRRVNACLTLAVRLEGAEVTTIEGLARAEAHAWLDAGGTAVVQSAASDAGPGTYTSMTQVAADALGLAVGEVEFRLGDTLMPMSPPQGSSQLMASVGSAVQDTCDKLRLRAIRLAVRDQRSPLHGVNPDNVVVIGGRLQVKGRPARGETYRQLLARNNLTHLEANGLYDPEAESPYSMFGYSAVFAEVGVDTRLGLVRVRRMLSVYDAGRIISPKLADYLVPVNADIPRAEADLPRRGRPQGRPHRHQGPGGTRQGRRRARHRQRGLPRHRTPRPRTAHHRRSPALRPDGRNSGSAGEP